MLFRSGRIAPGMRVTRNTGFTAGNASNLVDLWQDPRIFAADLHILENQCHEIPSRVSDLIRKDRKVLRDCTMKEILC
jgi:hypothetical protein